MLFVSKAKVQVVQEQWGGGWWCSGALEVLTNKRWNKHSRPLSKEKSWPSVESLKYWGEGVLPPGLPQGSGSSGRPVGHRDQLRLELFTWKKALDQNMVREFWGKELLWWWTWRSSSNVPEGQSRVTFYMLNCEWMPLKCMYFFKISFILFCETDIHKLLNCEGWVIHNVISLICNFWSQSIIAASPAPVETTGESC